MIQQVKFSLSVFLFTLFYNAVSAQTNIQLLLAEGNYTNVINYLEQQQAPLRANEYYYLAIAYQQSGFHQKAIDCLLKDSVNLSSQQFDLLSRCFITSGQYAKALPICQNKYKSDPLDHINIIRYAEINNFYKNHDLNIDILTQYISHDSLNYNINLLLAESYHSAELFESAIEVYEGILRQYPDNQKIAFKLARLFYSQKDYEACHNLCVPFIEKYEKNKNFLILAGLANYKTGSNHNVLVMFNRLEASGDSSFLTKKHLGITYYRLENYDKAINYLKSAFNYKDDDPEAAYFLGAALGQSNQPLSGKIFLELAQELIKPSPALMEKSNAKLALMHFDTGNYQKAIQYYNEAHKYAPDNPQYIYYQASIYDYKLKYSTEAMGLYQSFIESLPNDLNPKKGNELYAIKLKEVANNRLTILKEERFFKNGH